jgi:hypothetical protein
MKNDDEALEVEDEVEPAEPEDFELDEDALDDEVELDEDALDDVDVDEGDDDDVDVSDEDEEDDGVAAEAGKAKVDTTEESDEEDDEEDDDVEASLDVILQERLRTAEADGDGGEEEDDEEPVLAGELAAVIPVRRPEEFLCQSCFLLKPPSQMADIDHQLCKDCA